MEANLVESLETQGAIRRVPARGLGRVRGWTIDEGWGWPEMWERMVATRLPPALSPAMARGVVGWRDEMWERVEMDSEMARG